MPTSGQLKTPLHAWHCDHGGKIVSFGGWEMPVQYEKGILTEHLATRRSGGFFDVSHMGRFRVEGKDTMAFLQRVLTNDSSILEPWQAQYTLLANETGGVIDDAYLYHPEGEYLIVVNASNRKKDWDHFQEEARQFQDLELLDLTEEMAMIAVQGPQTEDLISSFLEQGSLPLRRHNSLSKITMMGVDILISRTGYTGEPHCFEMFIPAGKVSGIWEMLHHAGISSGFTAVGLGARDTLRLEARLPLYGHELGIDPEGVEIPAYAFPLTAYAVSFAESKGNFIGREALARQYQDLEQLRSGNSTEIPSLPKKIFALHLLDRGVMRQGDVVFKGETRLGTVTSGTVVPYWKFSGLGESSEIADQQDRRSIGLALLSARTQIGTDLEIEVRGRRLKARVVSGHGSSKIPPYFRALIP